MGSCLLAFLFIMQIQLTLEAADKAFSSGVSEPCITQFARGATLEDTCGAIINGVSKGGALFEKQTV